MDVNDQIVYYWRNGWRMKAIAEKTGLTVTAVKGRLARLRKKQKVERWWKED